MSVPVILARVGLFVLLSAAVSACEDSNSSTLDGAQRPPSQVSVYKVKPEALPILNDLPGRVAPTRIAEVRPRVSGIVVERVFQQGSMVEEGETLYRIDDTLFQVQVESAEATLRRAQAVQLQARQEADRQRALKERNIASAQQLDTVVAKLAQADADVAAAQAGLSTAKLNLEYSVVTAPIRGRIGRAQITEGALVSSAESLATIQQFDPVYVDFTQSSAELLRLRRALEKGLLESPAPDEASVRLTLDDGTEFEDSGRLLFSEATVDPTTGQVTMRAEFPNRKGDLLPGLYVRVLIEQALDRSALAIPQQSVQRNASGQSLVYVVKDDNTVEARTVQLGRAVGNRFTVVEGLAADERIVVEGFQKIGPGASVQPEEWNVSPGTQSEAGKG